MSNEPVSQISDERRLIDYLWQEFCELPDRSSPEEYPDMALVSLKELTGIVESFTELQSRRSTHEGEAGLSQEAIELLTEAQQSLEGVVALDEEDEGPDGESHSCAFTAAKIKLLLHRDKKAKSAPLDLSPKPLEITATHRHKKRGTEYVLIGIGKMQTGWCDGYGEPVDMAEVAIYRSAIDPTEIWVRPREEFEDGRFEALTASLREGV